MDDGDGEVHGLGEEFGFGHERTSFLIVKVCAGRKVKVGGAK